MLGVGEAGGVKEYSVRFRMVIKVDAGINKYISLRSSLGLSCRGLTGGRVLALDEELMVATMKPSAIQCIRWQPDSTGSQTTTELLSRMPWMQKKG